MILEYADAMFSERGGIVVGLFWGGNWQVTGDYLSNAMIRHKKSRRENAASLKVNGFTTAKAASAQILYGCVKFSTLPFV